MNSKITIEDDCFFIEGNEIRKSKIKDLKYLVRGNYFVDTRTVYDFHNSEERLIWEVRRGWPGNSYRLNYFETEEEAVARVDEIIVNSILDNDEFLIFVSREKAERALRDLSEEDS